MTSPWLVNEQQWEIERSIQEKKILEKQKLIQLLIVANYLEYFLWVIYND